jgi:thymidylate synthase (FAD)
MSEDVAPAEVPEFVERPRSEELDKILGKAFRVLDDGFVRAVDYMGTDASIVQAARVSYGKGTKKVHEDRGLIRYLMRHRHTTPLEMCELKLHVRVPMDCWRQWIRHRTANVNEYSTRYSEAIDSMQKTAPSAWRAQAATNKQGSTGTLDEGIGRRLTEREEAFQREARAVYAERLQAGAAREQARKDLPLSTYTEAYWKIDLHNLLHFLSLRMHSHAQQEIREYANVIGREIVQRWCPLAWEAFEDYRLGAVFLTRAETEIAAALIRGDAGAAVSVAIKNGMLDADGKPLEKSRERAELEEKFRALSIKPPWA